MHTIKRHRAFLLMEVAVVVLVTAVIALFLFRGFSLFLKTQRHSLDYMKLGVKVSRDLWELRQDASNAAYEKISVGSDPLLRQATITTSLGDDSRTVMDTVVLLPADTQEETP